MSKQEEIREHLIELLEQSEGDKPDSLADAILWVLNEGGVVIKVDKELPDISYHSAYPENEERYQQAMLDAGYGAFKPLIGGE